MSRQANHVDDLDQIDNPTKLAAQSKFNDLEKMINDLPLDEDEEIGEEEHSPAGKKLQRYESIHESKKNSVERRQTIDMDFPIVCFKGAPADEIISNEDKYHAPTLILSIKTMEYELDKIIEPALKSKEIAEPVMKKLLKKKAALTNQLSNYEKNIQNGKLNSKTFPGIIKKAIQDNTVLMKIAETANRKLDVFRLETRLKILQKELNEWSPNNIGETIKKMETLRESGIKKSAPVKRQVAEDDDIKPTHKPLSDYQVGNMTVSSVLGHVEQMKPDELMKLMTLRKAQYYNMATYLKSNYLPFLPKEEQMVVESRLRKEFLPLLQKIKDLTTELEAGKTQNASRFIMKELPEATPELFHQMSLTERKNKLNKIIETCQEALNGEEEVTGMLQSSMTNSKEHASTRKKLTEAQKNIEEYNKIIASLEELHNEPWIPLPKYTVAYENRSVSVQNSDIEPHILQIKFNQISKCPTKSYYIEYSIANENNTVEVSRTNDSEYNTGIWNYQRDVALVKKGSKLNPEVLKRTIKFELISSGRGCCFSTGLKGSGEISLESLNHENTVMGRVSAQPGSKYSYDIEYTLRIREPVQAKRKKFAVFKLDKMFPKLDVNAKLPEPKNVVKEETKSDMGVVNQQQQQPQSQPQQQQQSAGGVGELVITKAHEAELKTIQKSQMPPGIAEEDVLTPDKCEKNQCYSYLQQLVGQLEKAKETYMSGFGSVSEAKAVRDKWSVAFKAFTVLEASLQNGTIQPDEYLVSLTKLAERDQKILELYESKNLAKMVSFMSAKLGFFQNEIAEMKEQMNG